MINKWNFLMVLLIFLNYEKIVNSSYTCNKIATFCIKLAVSYAFRYLI